MDIIKEDAFRKQLKKGLSGSYLFFGDEDYLKSFSLRSAREAVCPDETFAVFNDIRIDALDYSPTVLMNAITPPPMMADKKIVTLSGLALNEMRQGELEELYEVLSTLPDYEYNVLIISVPSGLIDEGFLPKRPSPVLTELSKYLTPVRFETVPESRLSGWVAKHFEHNGVSASPSLCSLLIERVGQSMFTLASETEKISYYVLSHGRSVLTESDVKNASVSVIDADTYALTNAILDGRQADAMHALNVLRFRRIEPVVVLGELSSSICEMLAIKLLLLQGQPISEMARILKAKSEYRIKLYASAMANKSEERLRRALLLCSEADLSLKLSMQGYTSIERLICSI